MQMKQAQYKEKELGQIPGKWQINRFSEAVEVNPRRTLKKGASAKKVSMQNLQEFKRKIAGYEIAQFSGGTKFRNNDTLMARITPCLENGKTSFVDMLDKEEIGFGSTEFNVLCGKEGKTTDMFVYYLSRSPHVRAETIKSMVGTSGRQRVQSDVFDNMMISIPPIEEQKDIAKILSDLDSKIELNQQANETLEFMGQTLFKRWFIDFEFPNKNGETYGSSGGEMVKSELGELPKGWTIEVFNKLIVHNKETINPSSMPEDRFLHYSIAAYDRGKTPNLEVGKNILSNKFRVKEYSILLCKLNPRFSRCWAVRNADNCSVSSTEFLVFVPREKAFYSFIYFLLTSGNVQGSLRSRITGTSSSHQRVRPKDILSLELKLPPVEVLIKFHNVMDPLLELIDSNIKQNLQLSQIRDSLLPRLMSGRIRVPIGGA